MRCGQMVGPSIHFTLSARQYLSTPFNTTEWLCGTYTPNQCATAIYMVGLHIDFMRTLS